MTLLVVTADDFGLTHGVNRAVLRSHREGIVTSTSLLAVGRAYRSAVELARTAPALAVGVHLAAVGEDPPVLPARQVRSLVDSTGHFPLSYRSVLQRAALGRLDIEDLRREFRAQVERVLGDGVAVTHLDTHQHLHLWPTVARVVVELAREFDIPAVRLPRSSRLGPRGIGVRVLAESLRRQLDHTGLHRTADFVGLDEAGAMDRHLTQALRALARRNAATAELNAHPGEADDADLARFAWGYRWDRELEALTGPDLPARLEAAGIRLVSWAELAASGAAG